MTRRGHPCPRCARHTPCHNHRPVRLLESVATAVRLHEAGGGGIRSAGKAGNGEMVVPVDIIWSGWNKSGKRYYPSEVLERDVPLVYPAGTQMYIDHPSVTEADDRPERSLQTLAAVFLDDPKPHREGDRVVMRTQARVFAPWQPLIRETWQHIGVSINGSGTGEYGSRDGQEGLIIDGLTEGQSVDFVTRPGAGGRITALMESAVETATREGASLGAHVEARIHTDFTVLADELYADGRLTRDERIALSSAVGDALAALVARVENVAPQLYTRDRWQDAPAPMPVRLSERTGTSETAVGGTPADSAGGTPEITKEAVMAEIPDQELVKLRESATAGETARGQVTTLTQERDEARTTVTTVTRERDEALGRLARYTAADAARPVIDELLRESGLPEVAANRVRAGVTPLSLPLTESTGQLDEAKLRERVAAEITGEKAYVTSLAESAGMGAVSGFGTPAATVPGAGYGQYVPGLAPWSAPAQPDTSQQTALKESYIARGMSEKAAELAARGRAN